MSVNYTRVNFQNGERLQASDLNHMDEQIEKLTEQMSDVPKVLYAEQNLTPEQKAQARKNIGVEGLLVVTDNGGQASATPAEIYAHIQNGGTAMLLDGSRYLSIENCSDTVAFFTTLQDINGMSMVCKRIDSSGKVTNFENNCATKKYVDTAIANAPSKLLIVTVTDNADGSRQASATAGQIYTHIQNGGTAVLSNSDSYFNLAHCFSDFAYFSTRYDDGSDQVIVVNSTGNVSIVDINIPTTEYVNTEIDRVIKSKLLVVKIEGNVASADPNKIYFHILGGGTVVIEYNGAYYNLETSFPTQAVFSLDSYPDLGVHNHTKITILSDKSLLITNFPCVMTDYVDSAIEEALKDIPSGTTSSLPEVTTADAGKILRVSANGTWEVQSLVNAEEVAF